MTEIVPDTQASSDEVRDLPIEQLATLLRCALDDAHAQWGCVLTTRSVSKGQALVVIDRAQGNTLALTDTAAHTDALLLAAFERTRPVFANRVTHPTLAGLPEGYPAIEAFALLPCQYANNTVAVLCLVNPKDAFASPIVNRLHAQMRLLATTAESLTQHTVSDELSVYFQPQWRLDNGSLYGLEVLTRWHGRSDSLSTPRCLRSIQEHGKMPVVGFQIITLACEHWAAWTAADLIDAHVTMAINIAREQILAADFITQLLEAVNTHDIQARRVVLEIHEDIWLDTTCRNTLEEVARNGFRLAIDGFGTGQSSLPSLARLPVDQLKLCHAFGSGLANNAARYPAPGESQLDDAHDGTWNTLSGIVELAHCLALPVIAQGIENPAMREAAVAAGCTACQGYGLVPPLPATEIPALLEQASRCEMDALAHFVNLSDERSAPAGSRIPGHLLDSPA